MIPTRFVVVGERVPLHTIVNNLLWVSVVAAEADEERVAIGEHADLGFVGSVALPNWEALGRRSVTRPPASQAFSSITPSSSGGVSVQPRVTLGAWSAALSGVALAVSAGPSAASVGPAKLKMRLAKAANKKCVFRRVGICGRESPVCARVANKGWHLLDSRLRDGAGEDEGAGEDGADCGYEPAGEE